MSGQSSSSTSRNPNSRGGQEPLLAALMEQFADINRRLDEMDGARRGDRPPPLQRRTPPPQRRNPPPQRDRRMEDEYDEEEYDEGGRDRRRQGRDQYRIADDNLGNIKSKIPEFKGRNDPEQYLEWEKKIENVFDIYDYSERKKVKLAATEFSNYALTWWDQVVTSRRRNFEPPIETWRELKALMRKRYVPAHYYREVHRRLLRLTQGSMSVEEYHQEMEVLMIRSGIEEDDEMTMARFLAGLNTEISNEVELHNYVQMEDLVHKAIQVERQFNSGSRKIRFGDRQYRKQPVQRRDDEVTPTSFKPEFKSSSSRDTRGNNEASSGGSSTIKCFKCFGRGHIASQCPNKRAMIMREDGSYETDSDSDKGSGKEEHEGETEMEHKLATVTRRELNTQVVATVDVQRENLFYGRCRVKDSVCSMIIDSGSCTNVVSQVLVDKLALPLLDHPQPYKLHGLIDSDSARVTKQVLVEFKVERFEDEVLCDVVPMEATHLLLGRPWQFDRRVTHDGYTNNYTVPYKKKFVTLKPLFPNQVQEDQSFLRDEYVRWGKTKGNILSDTRVRKREKHWETHREKKQESGSIYEKQSMSLILLKKTIFGSNVPSGKPRGINPFGSQFSTKFYEKRRTRGRTVPKTIIRKKPRTKSDSRSNPFEEGENDVNRVRKRIGV